MSIETDIKVIKETIEKLVPGTKKRRAKLQKTGKDHNGKERHMIYVTAASREEGWVAGDIVEYTLTKVGHKTPVVRNPEFSKYKHTKGEGTSYPEPKQSKAVAPKPVILEEDPETITPEEKDFLDRYAKAPNESLKSFMLSQARDSFGYDRVEFLLSNDHNGQGD